MMVDTVPTILRVWAMYNRSKVILGTFLTLLTLEIISTLLADAIFQDLKYMSGMWMLAGLIGRCTDPPFRFSAVLQCTPSRYWTLHFVCGKIIYPL